MVNNLHEIDLFKVALHDQQIATANKLRNSTTTDQITNKPTLSNSLASPPLRTVANKPVPADQSSSQSKNKRFALIVCSHQAAVSKLEDYCHHLNVGTYVAQDGLEALKWLRIQKPNLLIISSVLPKMSASQLIALIRRNQSLQSIPIILLNQENDLFISAIAKSLSIESCLNAPIKQSTIAKQIKKYCAYSSPRNKPMLGIISDTPSHRLVLRQRLVEYNYDICFNADPSQLEGSIENLDKIVDGWILDITGEEWLDNIDQLLERLNSPVLYGLEPPPVYSNQPQQIKDPKYVKWESKLISKIKGTIK
ncbi:response regulator [Endozoicomonas sp. SM1973]|uniref:Response regulator n=1 Tax=Spartinivicinus marinus TaxID=2994442 RepID=A0A853I8F8_9GAMM|nr:response regulator [Spartinivicinus marinus]MCX4026062.1 response regulator [Spartinivicinus marinus]NYZ69603.1 response regulator [Spartinivicinus marinus]